MLWSESAETHEVFNQPPPFEGTSLYRSDPALIAGIERYGGAWGTAQLEAYGIMAGGPLLALGVQANRQAPEFHSHDRYGRRLDRVEFHPAWHGLLDAAVNAGIPSAPWSDPRPGAQVVRAGLMYLHNQAEAGSSCPLTMTYASVAALRQAPALAALWLPKVLARTYDPRELPVAEKDGALLGMAMTEKQGGTDLRATTTQGRYLGDMAEGRAYELLGHKWFCSAPMSDGWLTLAQTEGGLTCLLLPRIRPDGSKNSFHIQRLKDKLGNRANASCEIEFRGALAWQVGEEGRGIATLLQMVALTRFDCLLGSASLMRQALAQAVHHCRHRQVGGRPLVAQPLMTAVLADLALESEAALALALRLAQALERPADARERQLLRLFTAVGKFWVCKRAPAFINEAAECLGGAGYIEDSNLPRLYREAPVNSIWEGSGNVQCLDVLRALERESGLRETVLGLLAGSGDARLEARVARLGQALAGRPPAEAARRLCEDLALALQARLLLEGDAQVAEAFIATRLQDGSGRVYGALPPGVPTAELVARALA